MRTRPVRRRVGQMLRALLPLRQPRVSKFARGALKINRNERTHKYTSGPYEVQTRARITIAVS